MKRVIVMARHPIAVLALALVVTACGSSPPVHFYTLSPPVAASVEKTGHATVAFGPLVVADYLQRPQIVVRDSNQQLHLAEFNRWAEPTQSAIARWLALDIDRQFAGGVVVESSQTARADYRVRGQILQWDVDASSNAVLVAQWEVVDHDGKAVAPWRTSRFNATVKSTSDYNDVVRGLNQTLAEFADEIASALGGLPVQSGGQSPLLK